MSAKYPTYPHWNISKFFFLSYFLVRILMEKKIKKYLLRRRKWVELLFWTQCMKTKWYKKKVSVLKAYFSFVKVWFLMETSSWATKYTFLSFKWEIFLRMFFFFSIISFLETLVWVFCFVFTGIKNNKMLYKKWFCTFPQEGPAVLPEYNPEDEGRVV